MKTKIVIFNIRRIVEMLIALVIFAVGIKLCIQYLQTIELLHNYWPFICGLVIIYAALTYLDDYVNDRILQKF